MHDQITELAELRQSVERLTRKIEFIMRELHLSDPDADLPAHILLANELLRQGRDQEAIKVVREHTAIGIIEAREVVEQMRVKLQLPPRVAEPAPKAAGDVDGVGLHATAVAAVVDAPVPVGALA